MSLNFIRDSNAMGFQVAGFARIKEAEKQSLHQLLPDNPDRWSDPHRWASEKLGSNPMLRSLKARFWQFIPLRKSLRFRVCGFF